MRNQGGPSAIDVVVTTDVEQELIDALVINEVTLPVGAWCHASSACFEGYSDPPCPASLGQGAIGLNRPNVAPSESRSTATRPVPGMSSGPNSRSPPRSLARSTAPSTSSVPKYPTQ